MSHRAAASTEWIDISAEDEPEQEAAASTTTGGRARERPEQRWARLTRSLRRIVRLRKIWHNLGQHLKRYTALR